MERRQQLTHCPYFGAHDPPCSRAACALFPSTIPWKGHQGFHTSLVRLSKASILLLPSWKAVREKDSFSGSRFSRLKPTRVQETVKPIPVPPPSLGDLSQQKPQSS